MEKYELLPILLVRLLGKGQATKSDDFLEKFQMAYDPPLIFGKLYCKFFMPNMVVYARGDMMAG